MQNYLIRLYSCEKRKQYLKEECLKAPKNICTKIKSHRIRLNTFVAHKEPMSTNNMQGNPQTIAL